MRNYLLASIRPTLRSAVISAALWTCRGNAQADETSPFQIGPSLVRSNGETRVAVAFHLAAHHHIYSERIAVRVNGESVAVDLPKPAPIPNPAGTGEKLGFDRDFCLTLPWTSTQNPSEIAVEFQGCSDTECYFPETRRWKVDRAGTVLALLEDDSLPARISSNDNLTNGFRVATRATGFLNAEKFLGFLDQSEGKIAARNDLASKIGQAGVVVTLVLILLGGLALNLTPCVLPMIPINLAILGAGNAQQDRRRGFLLGAAYGGGMSLAYGGLGLAVVLTGARFGTLNASPWFNFAIAAVFVVLGLGMFDRFSIDFSRFQRSRGTSGASRGAVFTAVAMGGVSALLAGACVAPVVISVLLLAATSYQHGHQIALLLPFVLGLGMALPWPFAAAGLAFLPRPGAWMTRIKYGFGILIFAFAAWYGWLGWNLSGLGARAPVMASARGAAIPELEAALQKSRSTGQPVMVDFWASWCKNCEAMEQLTFRDREVRRRLADGYITVRFQAEHLNDPALKPVLDAFGVIGLPTCIVLKPETALSGARP